MIGLIGKDGRVGYQKGRYGGGYRQSHSREAPRCQQQILITHDGTGVDGGACSVQGVIDEVKRAVSRKARLIAQGNIHFVGEGTLLLCALTLISHVIRLAHVEVEENRIERDQSGEKCGAAAAAAATRD